jgi:FtsP/CotA-like multicopper oxidase with cupredoxin domain
MTRGTRRFPSQHASPASIPRRRMLQALAALGVASAAPATRSDSAVAVAGAGEACASGAQWTQRLFIPGDSGYLARIGVGDAPLALRAGARGALPAQVVHGPLAYAVQNRGRECLNPTLVVRSGTPIRATLENALDAPTIVHWHGLALDTKNDGAGMALAAPGQRYEYAFDVRNRSGLYWYHPHPHGASAGQVYRGLYGALEVEDDDEIALRKALDLVPGRTELILVLQDRRQAPGYAPGEPDIVHGFAGDDLYVNGTHCAWHEVGTRLYRLRLLNACNARTLRLAFRTASGARVPFTLIGNDGGLLESPKRCEQAFFAAAERLDLLLDLTAMPVGEAVVLESLAFDPMHAEVTRSAGAAAPMATDSGHAHQPGGTTTSSAHAHGAAWPEGAQRALLEFRVRERVDYARKVPERLSTVPAIDVANARERPLRLGFNKGRWRINDRVFAMGETPIEVTRDTTEVWLLRNYYTSMPHAMHLHGFQFQVIERETSPDFVSALKIDDRGRLATDLGLKDTVLVWPGESVRIAIRFALPWPGEQTYVFHCHNLEHEDGGMMLGVKVA